MILKNDKSSSKIKNNDSIEFKEFFLPKNKNKAYKINMKYNYFLEDLKVDGFYSNNFENCFIDI